MILLHSSSYSSNLPVIANIMCVMVDFFFGKFMCSHFSRVPFIF